MKLKFLIEIGVEFGVEVEATSPGGGWVLDGWWVLDFTRLMQISTQVEVVVEVGVELGKK